MKVTKWVVKNFEEEQKRWGTKLAISNLIWLIATELLKDIGVIGIKTKYKKGK